MSRKCSMKKQTPRHRITLALDGDVWAKFQPALKNDWEGSFTAWVEYAMTCYSMENCNDCPYVSEEDKGKGLKPTGIGRISDNQ
jgi:hypothetical protein